MKAIIIFFTMILLGVTSFAHDVCEDKPIKACTARVIDRCWPRECTGCDTAQRYDVNVRVFTKQGKFIMENELAKGVCNRDVSVILSSPSCY